MRGLGQSGPFFVGLMVVFVLVKGLQLPALSQVFADGGSGSPLSALVASVDAACEGQAALGEIVGAGNPDGRAPFVADEPVASEATGVGVTAKNEIRREPATADGRTGGSAVEPADGIRIREEAIRIRILAHSNREEDQAVKRKVRDRVTALIASWPAPDTLAEARATLRTHLAEIEAAAEAELARWGAPYGAKAYLGDVPFPAKTFGGRTYPAGDYEALLITLGDGEGDNWWCVLFPPLCLTGAVADDGAEAERPKETAGSERPKPKVRFFLWDLLVKLWESLKSLFS